MFAQNRPVPTADPPSPAPDGGGRWSHAADLALGDVLRRGRPSVSVVVPARDERSTIAATVATIVDLRAAGAVDEIVVVDDHSVDDTAAEAAAAGATVVDAASTLPAFGAGGGKGAAMWKGLAVTSGELVVFCDADIEAFPARFVTGLLAPLVMDDAVQLVKGRYERPYQGRPGEGGRVTELLARPVLDLLFPAAAGMAQPLGGETAARRSLLERLPFPPGYGVEIGLLVDAVATVGRDAVAEVDLGPRVHRNRPLAELRPLATEVLATALARAGVVPPGSTRPADLPPLASIRGS